MNIQVPQTALWLMLWQDGGSEISVVEWRERNRRKKDVEQGKIFNSVKFNDKGKRINDFLIYLIPPPRIYAKYFIDSYLRMPHSLFFELNLWCNRHYSKKEKVEAPEIIPHLSQENKSYAIMNLRKNYRN